MWICKKCGSELKKIIGIRYLSHVTMLKDGYPKKEDGRED